MSRGVRTDYDKLRALELESVKTKAREIFEARYPNGAWSLVRGNDRKHYMHRAATAIRAALEPKP